MEQKHLINRRILTLGLISLPLWANAAPRPYRLDQAQSSVSFTYVLAGNPGRGHMPVERADMVLDIANPAQSQVSAVLRPDLADAGPDFATNALRGAELLDTDRFPRILFQSTEVSAISSGATLKGNLTIRDITRPVTLDAQFFRKRGSQEGDLSNLTIILKGSIRRQDFGASGYAGLVGDQIGLTVLANVTEV